MVEKTIQIDDTEVEIRETDDGFEAVEVVQPGTKEHFLQEISYGENDRIAAGYIESIESVSGGVKVHVEDQTHDVLETLLWEARDANWYPSRVEFEFGYVKFEYEE